MTYTKLEKLARNLFDELKHSDTPSDVYTNIMQLGKQQPDFFFEYLGPQNIIKLTILVWSLIKTDDFKLSDKAFNNINFVTFLTSDLTHPDIDCPECSGNGTIPCDDCNGSGRIQCENCDGDGVEDCTECDGTGVIEDEDGQKDCPSCDGGSETCSNCSGDGDLTCTNCGGDGDITCPECNGDETIEDTDKYKYDIYYIVNWNSQINYWAENSDDPKQAMMDVSDLSDFSEEYILTFIDEYGEGELDIREGLLYFMDESDDPKMDIFRNQAIVWKYDDIRLNDLE
jgi:hypothetical protein